MTKPTRQIPGGGITAYLGGQFKPLITRNSLMVRRDNLRFGALETKTPSYLLAMSWFLVDFAHHSR